MVAQLLAEKLRWQENAAEEGLHWWACGNEPEWKAAAGSERTRTM